MNINFLKSLSLICWYNQKKTDSLTVRSEGNGSHLLEDEEPWQTKNDELQWLLQTSLLEWFFIFCWTRILRYKISYKSNVTKKSLKLLCNAKSSLCSRILTQNLLEYPFWIDPFEISIYKPYFSVQSLRNFDLNFFHIETLQPHAFFIWMRSQGRED